MAERQAQELAPPGQGNAEMLAGMFQLARDTVTQLADVQSLKHTLSNEATVQLGVMWGRVLDGYGIKLSAYVGRHGDLIMATVATLAIAKGVVQGYQQEMGAKRVAAAQPEAAPLQTVPAE